MRRIAGVGAALAGLAVSSACLAPTQITLVIDTDIPCADLSGVSLWAGPEDMGAGAAPSTETAECDPVTGKIGTLVVVPSPARGRISIRVVGAIGKSPEACTGADPKCVVALRRLGFVPHTPLKLPVRLAARCLGKECPTGQTCVAGACADASVQPESCATERGCDESTLTPVPPVPPVPPAVVDDPSCALVPELAGTIAWPNEGRCPNRAGRTPLLGPPPDAKVLWRLPLPAATTNNDPVIGPDGTIYVTHGRRVVAARPDGTKLFETLDLGGVLPLGAVVTRDAVVVAHGTGAVVATGLDPKTGSTLWQQPLANVPMADATQTDLLLIPNNVVVLSTMKGLAGIVATTGAVLWSAVAASATPVLASGRLYVATGTRVDAYDASNGVHLGGRDVADPLFGFPAAGSGRVYAGGQGALHAVAVDFTGATQDPQIGPLPRPAIAPTGTVYAYGNSGQVIALSPDLTTRSWARQASTSGITGAAAVDGEGTIYYVDDAATVHSLDGPSGTPKLALPIGGGTSSSPAIGEGRRLYFVNGTAELVCVGPP